jgi:hypothetical protein
MAQTATGRNNGTTTLSSRMIRHASSNRASRPRDWLRQSAARRSDRADGTRSHHHLLSRSNPVTSEQVINPCAFDQLDTVLREMTRNCIAALQRGR